MDFNPFGITTDSLLYSWEELLEKERELIKQGEDRNNSNCCHSTQLENSNSCRDSERKEEEFKNKLDKLDIRIVETDIGISLNQYSMYSQPREALEHTSFDGFDFKDIDNRSLN